MTLLGIYGLGDTISQFAESLRGPTNDKKLLMEPKCGAPPSLNIECINDPRMVHVCSCGAKYQWVYDLIQHTKYTEHQPKGFFK